MKNPRNFSATSGLTLIEILVSIAIFALLSGVIMSSMSMSQRVNRDSRDEQIVSTYARTAMETAKAGILTRTNSTTDPYPYLTSGTLPALPAKPAGMNCTDPVVSNLTTYKVRSVTLGSRATLTITCTLPNNKTIPFIEQVVRPS